MAIQYSINLRQNLASAIGLFLGNTTTACPTVAPTTGTFSINLYTGAPPANCATAEAGTLLATGSLPLGANLASGTGAVATSLVGTWTMTGSAGAGGTAGHFRVLDSAGNCVMQGTAGTSGTDMILASATIAPGMTINITSFTDTIGGA